MEARWSREVAANKPSGCEPGCWYNFSQNRTHAWAASALPPMGRAVARPGPPTGQRGQAETPVVQPQIQGPARFSQPFGQPFHPPVQAHQGRQTDGFPPGCVRRILFPDLDESVAPGESFRGQRLWKGLPGKLSQNIGIFFTTGGMNQP
jgi:hypothetical protein